MARRKMLLMPAVAIVIAAALVYFFALDRPAAPTGTVQVSGNIEITDAEVSFKIAGRVGERLVSEGQRVRAGQVVARLDATDLQQEVELRQAAVAAAQATLDELEAGSRPEQIAEAQAAVEEAEARLEELLEGSRPQEVREAEAAVEAAEATAHRNRREYLRQKELHEQGVSTTRNFETAQMAHEAAQADLRRARERLALVVEGPRREQIQQARAALAQARERHSLAVKGPRQERIARARAEVRQAEAALALARTRLDYSTLRSPLTGLVLSDNIEPGEYVSPGTPVLTVGEMDEVWLRAYINETDLGRVKVGQPAQLTTDTYPGKEYPGTVTFIASEAEFTPKNVQTQEQRVKLVYRVKITVPNPHMELKPGMPADAEITVEGKRDNAGNTD